MAGRRCGRRRDACGRDPMPCAERMANGLTLTLLLSSFTWCAGYVRMSVRGERYPPCFFAERFRRMHPGVVVVYVMRCGFLFCFIVAMCGVPGCQDSPRDQKTAPPFPAPLLSSGEKGRGYFFRMPFSGEHPPYKRSSLLQLPPCEMRNMKRNQHVAALFRQYRPTKKTQRPAVSSWKGGIKMKKTEYLFTTAAYTIT